MGSPEPDFLSDSQALSICSLCAGPKCSGAGCILQEHKRKWFCAPGIRQKAQNDNLSMIQSDNFKTFKVIFSISLKGDIFSTVWIKMFKPVPMKASSFPHVFACYLRLCISADAEPNWNYYIRAWQFCCPFFTVRSFCWVPETPICCEQTLSQVACGKGADRVTGTDVLLASAGQSKLYPFFLFWVLGQLLEV